MARFIAISATEMPEIAAKILCFKAFGVYPKSGDIELLVKPNLVGRDDVAYVLDTDKFEDVINVENIDLAFDEGDLDYKFKVGRRLW